MLVCVSSFTNTKPCWVTQYEKGPVSGLDRPTTQRALHCIAISDNENCYKGYCYRGRGVAVINNEETKKKTYHLRTYFASRHVCSNPFPVSFFIAHTMALVV